MHSKRVRKINPLDLSTRNHQLSKLVVFPFSHPKKQPIRSFITSLNASSKSTIYKLDMWIVHRRWDYSPINFIE